MPVEPSPWDTVSMPGLLRAARAVYGRVIRQALVDAGLDDVPRNGPYVLGALARGAAPLADIITALGVSKQASGQLVDSLVARSYLDRSVDADDRRRLQIALTPRGDEAAAVIRAAVDRVDAHWAALVGPELVRQTRAALGRLAEDAAHGG